MNTRFAARSFVLSHALFAALDLGLLEWLAQECRTDEDIKAWIENRGYPAQKIKKLLNVLVAANVIVVNPKGLEISSEWQEQHFLHNYVRWKSHTIRHWSSCTDVLRGAKPAVYGVDVYQHLGTTPELYPTFHSAMEVLSLADFKSMSRRVIESTRWTTQPKIIVDLGSGSASLSLILLSELSDFRCILVDLDTVAARERAARMGLSDRCEFLDQDVFAAKLPEAGIVIISNVLCDWDDMGAGKWLELAASVLVNNGILVISEHLSSREFDSLENAISDFIVAMETQGGNRDRPHFERLVDSLFSIDDSVTDSSQQTLMICRPVQKLSSQ